MARRALAISLALAVGIALVAATTASGATKKAAADYCRAKGGAVQLRYPAVGTNDPGALVLAGSVRFCRFVSASDGSRIFVAVNTLYARKPTLASLAYLTQPPVGEIPPSVSPASVYCSRLGGTDLFGGITAAGGGWVSRTDEVDPVLDVCVFPDGSMIDAWGITYHSWGIVRGKDLTRVFRYRSNNPPNVFPGTAVGA